MVNSSEFGNRLQKILNYYSISATELSNQISFNRSTISHLLSGRNKPSLDFVMKVLQKFPEVELYWLMNGKGNFPSDKNNNFPPTSTFQKEVKKPLLLKKEEKLELDPNQFSDPDASHKIDRIIIFFKDGSFKSFKN
ncbi:MAG: helix-turn-helix domain-containing protein [Flavobacteriaceae bacterium]|nr:helix-turn-helix domain-containing protein [Flavobacteriaceae bacterium]